MKKTLTIFFTILAISTIICGCKTTSCSTKKDQDKEIPSCNAKPTTCDINKPCAM